MAILSGCTSKPEVPAATSGRASELQPIVDRFELAQAAIRTYKQPDRLALRNDIGKLDAIIDAKPNDSVAAAAHFYAARIADLVNSEILWTGGAPDAQLAQLAITYYGAAIAYGNDVPEWNMPRLDVEYLAGASAYNYSKSPSMAANYWRICATADHAGCMNSLAVLLTKGEPGISQDFNEAFALHKKTVDTGIKFQCAGIYSAEDAASFVHFHLVTGRKGEEFDWLDKAHALNDMLAAREGRQDTCGAEFMLTEFMMRADDGEQRSDLLKSVLENSPNPTERSIAEYLLGTLDEASLENNGVTGNHIANEPV